VETDPRLYYIKKTAYRGNNGILLNPSATGLILDLIYVINVFHLQPKMAADSNSSATLTFIQLQILFILITF
jgi:hypothetical protein